MLPEGQKAVVETPMQSRKFLSLYHSLSLYDSSTDTQFADLVSYMKTELDKLDSAGN